MLTLIGISLLAVGVVSTNPPDISGNWQGEEWGQVTLRQTAPGQYSGTYTETVVKEKVPGKIELKWSRIEHRFNGTWREGDDDRFGQLSIRLIDNEIRGGLTTDGKSKINPGTPRLGDLVWRRAERPTTGPTSRAAVNAPHDSAAKFDGEHYALVQPSPKFTSDDFSISVWFKPVKTGGGMEGGWLFMRGYMFGDQPGDIGLALDDRTGRLGCHVKTADKETSRYENWLSGWNQWPRWPLFGAVRYDAWNHVVVTRCGNTYTMWMNGSRVGSETSAANISDDRNTNPLTVGGFIKDGGPEHLYHGVLGDFRIFDRCLSEGEILAFYKKGGDETFLRGEGRVKFGPLVAAPKVEASDTVRSRPLGVDFPHCVHDVEFDGRQYAKPLQPQKFTNGDFTISLWFKPVRDSKTSDYLFMRGFGYGDQRGDVGLRLNPENTDLAFLAAAGYNQWIFGWGPEFRLHGPVSYGRWNHVAVTRRGDAYAMWMNGVQVGTQNSDADIAADDNTNPFIVGGMMGKNGVGAIYRGALYELRIFRRCLSDEDIVALQKSNGGEAFLNGEGRVKFGPLCAGGRDMEENVPRPTPAREALE